MRSCRATARPLAPFVCERTEYTPHLLCGCIHTGTQKNTLCFLNAQIYREYFFPCFPFGLLTFLILKVDTHVDVRVVRCVCVCVKIQRQRWMLRWKEGCVGLSWTDPGLTKSPGGGGRAWMVQSCRRTLPARGTSLCLWLTITSSQLFSIRCSNCVGAARMIDYLTDSNWQLYELIMDFLIFACKMLCNKKPNLHWFFLRR